MKEIRTKKFLVDLVRILQFFSFFCYSRRFVRTRFSAGQFNYHLGQNFINPFNPEMSIPNQIAENAKVSIKIFNMLGREIRKLINETQAAGFHSAQRDGKDSFWNKIVSGIYLYKI